MTVLSVRFNSVLSAVHDVDKHFQSILTKPWNVLPDNTSRADIVEGLLFVLDVVVIIVGVHVDFLAAKEVCSRYESLDKN